MTRSRYLNPQNARDALSQRLTAVASTLGVEHGKATDSSEAAARCLLEITRTVGSSASPDRVWLLLTALAGAFPLESDVRSAVRMLELVRPDEASVWLLERAFELGGQRGSLDATLDVVSDIVVDVAYTATNNLHTGIQRVVRQTVPLWAERADLCLVAWTERGGAMRHVDDVERDRVLRWDGPSESTQVDAATTLVVPWQTTVLLTEVPPTGHCPPLSALAQYSGNNVAAIGYDCIPVVSADMLPAAEPEKFVQYLSVVKHSKAIAAISASATSEFEGFARMLPTQGLPSPRVVECALPVEVPYSAPTDTSTGVPTILSVGSHEPRKNQVSVMAAAERLWREGLAFQLRLVGGSGWSTSEFDEWVHQLRRRRRPLLVERSIDDQALWTAYRDARFTVFPSLHEGFGLPVAESLASGTPAITSDFGSMAEIATGGGALTIDPHDLGSLTDAMRRLLTDDDLLASLSSAARSRPRRWWVDYARESWQILTEGPLTP